jgi:hypothetical protein
MIFVFKIIFKIIFCGFDFGMINAIKNIYKQLYIGIKIFLIIAQHSSIFVVKAIYVLVF